MAKKIKEEFLIPVKETPQVENKRPSLIWSGFDQCWNLLVKGGSPVIKEAAKAHLKSLGIWERQDKWIDGLIHFGIPIGKR